MINFRYHVVSLVAVFFALSVGVLFGASFIDQQIVNVLEARQDNQEKTIGDLRGDFNRLQDENDQHQQFMAAAQTELLRNRLAQRRVVVVGFESTPDEVFDPVVSTLRASGVQLDGVFTLSERLDLASDVNRRNVATAVETSSDDPEVVRRALTERLGAALVGNEPGFLNRLIEAGLAQPRPVEGVVFGRPAELAAPDGAVLLLAPSGSSKLTSADALVLPLAASVSGANGRLVVAEPGDEELKLLPALRSSGDLRVSTIDGVDRTLGQISAVFALVEIFEGRFGHFGIGENATSPVPEIRSAAFTISA